MPNLISKTWKLMTTEDGRIPRSEFLILSVINDLIFFTLLLFTINFSLFELFPYDFLNKIISPIIGIIIFSILVLNSLTQYKLCIRRSHDYGKSGAQLSLVILFPPVGIYFFLETLIRKGNKNSNVYGKNPANEKDRLKNLKIYTATLILLIISFVLLVIYNEKIF